jgi:hypothetical protein
LSNTTSSSKSSVSWKSFSVSPGKPTITSADMAASGIFWIIEERMNRIES